MGNKLLLVIGLSCLPAICYLVSQFGRHGVRLFRRNVARLGADDIVQILLFAVALFCFGCCALLGIWMMNSGVPYYRMEKTLVLALLFLLLGIFCFQVLQFIRLQSGGRIQRTSERRAAGTWNKRRLPTETWLVGGQRGRM